MDLDAREWKGKQGESKWRRRMEMLESFVKRLILEEMETVDCQGFQLSRYAAELAEREGIDVGLIKRQLDLSPRERIKQCQQATNFVMKLREAGKRLRNEP